MFNRFIAQILVILLTVLPVYSASLTILPGRQGLVVWQGTLTGLRISSVNGTSFIDNAGLTVPTYVDGLHSIEIYDSSGRMLKGVLSSAGAGAEGLGADILPNNTAVSDSATEGNAIAGWTNAGSIETFESVGTGTPNVGSYHFHMSASGADKGISKTVAGLTAGQLYKIGFDKKIVSGSITTELWSSDVVTNFISASYSNAAYDSLSFYKNLGVKTGFFFRTLSNGGAAEWYEDNKYIRQVTGPSTSGAVIVSAKSGATQNFTSKDASFTYNAASYFVIVRALR